MPDSRRRQRSEDGSRNLRGITLDRVVSIITNAGPILSLAGSVILVAGLVVFITITELKGSAQVLMLVGLVMLLTSILTHVPVVIGALTARTGKYALNTLIMTTALAAILIMVGFISFENSYRIDVTATKQFTLAPQTKQVLESLEQNVIATVYSDPEDVRQEIIKRQADDYFFEFTRRNKNFTYKFVDPDLKPSQARRDGVTEYPTIVFKVPDSDTNPYLLTAAFFGEQFTLLEQDLVSAILISTGEQQKAVYFTTGHSEKSTVDALENSNGYGFARAGLLGDNYRVNTINLKQVEEIPGDAAVLIIAGPKNSFLADERAKIQEYLENGGQALFLLDDGISTQLNSLLNKWGVDLPNGTIVDIASSTVNDARTPIIRKGSYNSQHPVTKPLDDTFFIEATSVSDIIKRSPEGLPPNPDEINISLTPLAATSLVSCITTESDASDCGGPNDVFGPFAVAMSVEAVAMIGQETPGLEKGKELPVAEMIIFGDSDFASNKYYFALNNSDLFLNAVGWLAQKYDLISIRAKPTAFRLLVLDQKEYDFIRYSSWFLLPAGIMLLAGIAWWRRR